MGNKLFRGTTAFTGSIGIALQTLYSNTLSKLSSVTVQGAIDEITASILGTPALQYSSTSAYSVGSYCIKNGLLYKCIVSIPSGGEAWNAAHWALVVMLSEVLTKQDLSSSVTVNTSLFTKTRISTTVKNGHVTLQVICLGGATVPANTLHSLLTLPAGVIPTSQIDASGCVQDGTYLYLGGLLVKITSDGAVSISSNVAMSAKYVQFNIGYDL